MGECHVKSVTIRNFLLIFMYVDAAYMSQNQARLSDVMFPYVKIHPLVTLADLYHPRDTANQDRGKASSSKSVYIH